MRIPDLLAQMIETSLVTMPVRMSPWESFTLSIAVASVRLAVAFASRTPARLPLGVTSRRACVRDQRNGAPTGLSGGRVMFATMGAIDGKGGPLVEAARERDGRPEGAWEVPASGRSIQGSWSGRR